MRPAGADPVACGARGEERRRAGQRGQGVGPAHPQRRGRAAEELRGEELHGHTDAGGEALDGEEGGELPGEERRQPSAQGAAGAGVGELGEGEDQVAAGQEERQRPVPAAPAWPAPEGWKAAEPAEATSMSEGSRAGVVA
ncbi:MAG TPA: hypothetical protein VMU15_13780 [Anaeromyxobacter sp.]|nr:hypothetical protein [Anaeromyxobacter sp.]